MYKKGTNDNNIYGPKIMNDPDQKKGMNVVAGRVNLKGLSREREKAASEISGGFPQAESRKCCKTWGTLCSKAM